MENTHFPTNLQIQIQILKFMQATQCQTYQQAEKYLLNHNFNLQNAITSYLSIIQKNNEVNESLHSSGNQSNNIQRKQNRNVQSLINLNLSPEQFLILQQKLKQRRNSISINSNIQNSHQNKNCFHKLFYSCKKSFKCFKSLKKMFRKSLNLVKKQNQKIFYFNQIYQNQLNQANLQQFLIQSYQLKAVQDNQLEKILNKQPIKPIFAMIVPNRKSFMITNILRNKQTITFLRQNFEIILMTLSELRDLNLLISQKHSLSKISKCPTAFIYTKNRYNLEDILQKIEGQNVKQIDVQKLKASLNKIETFQQKWRQIQNLQNQVNQNLLTLQQFYSAFDQEDEQQYQETYNQSINLQTQNQQTKKALIKQQTKIYQQMLSEQTKRKKSIQLQQQKLQELRQEKYLRKISIPEQPKDQQICNSIQFRFRCPLNGQYITRRFLKNQKVDLLYQYVDTNDKIQFESDPQRSFELFMSYPPNPLSNKREEYLSNVFDQEKQNILIRQI